ncbi:MAG: hypothetical protein ACRC57_10290 [Sarcina sp.]
MNKYFIFRYKILTGANSSYQTNKTLNNIAYIESNKYLEKIKTLTIIIVDPYAISIIPKTLKVLI